MLCSVLSAELIFVPTNITYRCRVYREVVSWVVDDGVLDETKLTAVPIGSIHISNDVSYRSVIVHKEGVLLLRQQTSQQTTIRYINFTVKHLLKTTITQGQAANSKITTTIITRKLCYSKDDRAMRAI